MAPSRAPLLRITRATLLRPSPSARLLSTTSRIQPHRSPCQSPRSPALLHLRPSMRYATTTPAGRTYSTPSAPDYLNEAELHIFNKVKAELAPVKLEVQDISGGCGSMYALEVESAKFNGLSVIKQHKMVNEVLKEEIKGWHGVQLRTKAAA